MVLMQFFRIYWKSIAAAYPSEMHGKGRYTDEFTSDRDHGCSRRRRRLGRTRNLLRTWDTDNEHAVMGLYREKDKDSRR